MCEIVWMFVWLLLFFFDNFVACTRIQVSDLWFGLCLFSFRYVLSISIDNANKVRVINAQKIFKNIHFYELVTWKRLKKKTTLFEREFPQMKRHITWGERTCNELEHFKVIQRVFLPVSYVFHSRLRFKLALILSVVLLFSNRGAMCINASREKYDAQSGYKPTSTAHTYIQK